MSVGFLGETGMGMGTGMELMCSAPLHSQAFAALTCPFYFELVLERLIDLSIIASITIYYVIIDSIVHTIEY